MTWLADALCAAHQGVQRAFKGRSRDQINEIDRPRRDSQIDSCKANGQIETSRSGTSRVDIKNAIVFLPNRFVRMTADYDVDSRRCRVDIESIEIV